MGRFCAAGDNTKPGVGDRGFKGISFNANINQSGLRLIVRDGIIIDVAYTLVGGGNNSYIAESYEDSYGRRWVK